MKTAISIPDHTFERASRRAAALGMSRSEFFTRAVRRYLDELDESAVIREIDDALTRAGDDDSAVDAVAIGRRRLTEDDW